MDIRRREHLHKSDNGPISISEFLDDRHIHMLQTGASQDPQFSEALCKIVKWSGKSHAISDIGIKPSDSSPRRIYLAGTTPKQIVDLYNASAYHHDWSSSMAGAVRLLKILPGMQTDPVRCEFFIPTADRKHKFHYAKPPLSGLKTFRDAEGFEYKTVLLRIRPMPSRLQGEFDQIPGADQILLRVDDYANISLTLQGDTARSSTPAELLTEKNTDLDISFIRACISKARDSLDVRRKDKMAKFDERLMPFMLQRDKATDFILRNTWQDELTPSPRIHVSWTELSLRFPQIARHIVCERTDSVTFPAYAVEDYVAVSYSWNPHQPFVNIDLGPQKDFLVRLDVERVLRRLRHPAEARLVWIDCICIDQADLSERETQVAKMWYIFENAENVAVWLGEQEDADVVPRSELHSLASFLSADGPRSWWRRLWIFQESIAASRLVVMHGAFTTPWSRVIQLMQRLMINPARSELSAMDHVSIFRSTSKWLALDQARTLFRQDQKANQVSNLRALLLFTCNSHCSEPLDRIYALLGLLAPSDVRQHFSASAVTALDQYAHFAYIPSESTAGSNAEVEVEYGSAMNIPSYAKPVDLLFIQTMMFVINTNKSLDILVDPWPRRQSLGLSWVRDFASNQHIKRGLAETTRYSAGTAFEPEWTLESAHNSSKSDQYLDWGDAQLVETWFHLRNRAANPLLLVIKMIALDKIVLRGRSLDLPIGEYRITKIKGKTTQRSLVLSLIHMLSEQQGRHFKQDDPRHRIERMPSWDNNIPAHVPGQAPHLGRIFKCWQDALLNSPVDADIDTLVDAATRYLEQYDPDLSAVMVERRCFCTQHGLIGIGPTEMEAGDQVVVAFGASVPFVVRPHKSATWTLVGDAFVDGVMRGELIQLHQRYPEQVFAERYALR